MFREALAPIPLKNKPMEATNKFGLTDTITLPMAQTVNETISDFFLPKLSLK